MSVHMTSTARSHSDRQTDRHRQRETEHLPNNQRHFDYSLLQTKSIIVCVLCVWGGGGGAEESGVQSK